LPPKTQAGLERLTRLDRDPCLLFMEFMKHGDMWSLIAKCARERIKVPNRQLLRIFNCLVRACIAMEFPPRRNFGYMGREDWSMNEYEARIYLEETIPQGPNASRGFGLVHFDLDPQNVFVGDFDERRHRFGPVFKVGDFGNATRTSSDVFKEPQEAIYQRRFGKLLYYLPEQFHRTKEDPTCQVFCVVF
jgi:serine/threonine protein kinase